jgi:MarR family 2-MHQ and catechol resistance regulon transcriptional repressor
MRERDELINRIETAEERIAVLSMREASSSLLTLNITVQQFQVLLVLWSEGPVPAHVVGDVLRVGANAATGIVDRLAARDLVTRRESAQDRRVRLVELSEAGRHLVDELIAGIRAQRRRLLERLTTETLHQLEHVLAEITDVVTTTANAKATAADNTTATTGKPTEERTASRRTNAT